MTVVPFRPLPRRRPTWPVQPPPALQSKAPLPEHPSADAGDEDSLRMRQNLAALAAVALLLLAGIWIIDGAQRYARTLACIETGHRNCAVLDSGNTGRRR
jgi:hypothetical protein